MIAQFILSLLLTGILLYAWAEYRRSPAVAILAVFVATAGLYFVWFPSHSTQLAELVGIGRGVDLILYIWVGISLIVLLNVHLKLRTQMELVTIWHEKSPWLTLRLWKTKNRTARTPGIDATAASQGARRAPR